MSWSICVIGKPEDVVSALQEESLKLTGQCKAEFDDALPHMVGLLRQNFAKPGTNYVVPKIKLTASGSGSSTMPQGSTDESQREQVQRSCVVNMETFYVKIV